MARPSVARLRLDRARHWPGFAPEPLCDLDDVVSAIRGVAADEPFGRWLRVYRDGGQRADDEARIALAPPCDGESLHEFCQRIFGTAPFAIILNGCERWNEPLFRRIAAFVDPLLREQGLPLGGSDVVLFIGNYGFTPFGVHADREPGLLVHLGPAPKRFWIWSPATYRACAGTTDPSFDPTPLLRHTQELLLRPGDLLVLPAEHYHIGRADEFSVGLAISLGETTNHAFARNVVSRELARLVADVPGFELPFDDGKTAWPLRAAIEKPLRRGLRGARSTASWLHAAADERRLILASNAGFRHAPIERAVHPDALRGRAVVGVTPFHITHARQAGDRMTVFARGLSIRLDHHPRLARVLDELARGRALAVASIVARLSDSWTEASVLAVLNTLVEAGALDVTDRADAA